ncbi:aspartyl protease family protein [Cupriavidus metallidurans]|uniref:TIGR02281 family clan AA aspartic protease n=1 Tax=Aromatoleum toluolicum TaxID=90060 RepID=A0ABX1NID3_9RHOO|nr:MULTISPECIES: retropepsin-like aspartic protease [Pseudomonadota]MBI2750308.1 clan AA aspartic protease [Burkholderiales bacterium]EFP63544.1 clan AA aspartic protease, TIGR02281 family [Ralstonia pickettii]EGY60985.1 TIGR02281 family clan AA aspartic protease [Ralstonia sp. 5_2_56FAA]KAB0466837.1 TIGR02281 family clan AA aspartic protease [Ralstonia insidiosa]MBA9955316.1 TIGR02281 family clan AA aspartic protease [Ralstonia insidiosa]
MNATRALVALMACLAIGTSHAQQREYIVYDGQSYPGDQLDVAAASPVMVKPAQRLGNGDYSIPRAADGHYYIAGAVNGFPVVFMVDTGARFTTLPVKLARNAGIRAGRATSFDTAAGRERGGITAANTVIVGPFAVEGAAIAVLERLSAPLLGMDVLNRFQIAYSGGFMILRGGR